MSAWLRVSACVNLSSACVSLSHPPMDRRDAADAVVLHTRMHIHTMPFFLSPFAGDKTLNHPPVDLTNAADAVFLDLPAPHKAVPSVAKCLKPDGRWV